ncbi:hypothetical protein [Paenibacillus eucommiae]|uniref:Tripartite tricarboxylate transporter TctB family protein n=1 Tax=Paenibacillus eucommiae TaxID=1355755 RepID=A0ABS4IXQ0_9BACL|nr:hypothetical protein [Paenibacillus eucommiae]MBP1992360.1 hypothetical protein [Paenibacillus eucommiae]
MLASNKEASPPNPKRKLWLLKETWLFPLFAIWGIQGVANSLLDVAQDWYNVEPAKLTALLLAIFISAALIGQKIFLRLKEKTNNSQNAVSVSNWLLRSLAMLFPGAMLIIVILLLNDTTATGPFFLPILRACILAAFYILLGVVLSKWLVYLGIWLIALIAVMGFWYLGYSTVVLEGMGGLSLLLFSSMLRTWSR